MNHRLKSCLPTVVAVLGAAGCAGNHGRFQLFMAEDPDTGERAVYRLELQGEGQGPVEYYYSAAYIPAAAIDMYQGKLPKSLAELNAEAMGVSDAPQTIMENFHEALMARSAKRIEKAKAEPALPIDEEQAFLDELTRFYAQEMAQAMLSPSDLQSIDEQKSRELYRYRKLVYFISTKPLKMETFDAEVRDIQGTIEAIGTAVAGARAERKRQAAAAKQQRQASMGALTGFLEKQKGKDLKQYTGTEWIEVMTILGGLR